MLIVKDFFFGWASVPDRLSIVDLLRVVVAMAAALAEKVTPEGSAKVSYVKE